MSNGSVRSSQQATAAEGDQGKGKGRREDAQSLKVGSLVVPVRSTFEHAPAHVDDLGLLLVLILEQTDNVADDRLIRVRQRRALS